MGKKFLGTGLRKGFSDVTPKVQVTKAKINKWDYINLTSFFLHSKRNNQQYEKGTHRKGENICKTHIWYGINMQNKKELM